MKNKLKIDWKIITLILIFFIIFPLNLTFIAEPIWYFYIVYYIIFIFFWILPLYIILYKDYKKISILFLTVFVIFIYLITWYYAENYAKNNNINNIEKAKELHKKVEELKNIK